MSAPMPTMSAPLPRAEGMQTSPAHAWCTLHGPAVISVTLPARPTDDDMPALVVVLSAWSATVNRPFMFVLHLEHLLELTGTQRRMMADAEATWSDVDRRFNAGQALIAPSRVQRGMITAFNWLSRPVWPYRVVENIAEADEWLDRQWRSVTVDYPDGAVWLGRLPH